MMAIAPDPIANEQFQTRLEDLIEEIMRQQNVRLPGDRRLKLREQALRNGIPLTEKQYQNIISLSTPETEDQQREEK